MSKIPLQLGQQGAEDTRMELRATPAPQNPWSGWLAVGFGVLGIFGPAILFTPIGFVFSVIALFRGQATWGFVGLLLTVGGFLSSPLLMGLVGLSAFFMIFDWQDIMAPVYQLFNDTIAI